MSNQTKQIMVVVGEASGDVHGAPLINALLKHEPRIKVFGVAGEQMQQTDIEVLFNVSRLAGMGLIELAGNLANLWQAYRLLRQVLRERKPNLLVLIDFPEFNLRLAKLAKALHIPVLYYVSPQVWAWRRGRVRQIARWVDQMAVVFPFEVPFYQKHGVNVTFVGHPLLDTVQVREGREAILAKLGLDEGKTTIAILPGSRRREVSYHLPVLLEAAKSLSGERGAQFFCVRASTVSPAELQSILDTAGLKVPIVEDLRYDAINAADLVWTASGTATLESALLLKPMIIVYRLSWLTFCLARMLVGVEHIGMANLIAGEKIVPELIQSDFKAEKVVQESRIMLNSPQVRDRIIAKLSTLREKLGSPGAAERVADLAFSMMT